MQGSGDWVVDSPDTNNGGEVGSHAAGTMAGEDLSPPIPRGAVVPSGDTRQRQEGGTKNQDRVMIGSVIRGGRQVVLYRSPEHGFGFTLRHFIVYPPEYGEVSEQHEEVLFRGVRQPLDTIFVRQVRRGSPAHLQGLNTGDRLLSVNDTSVELHSYQQIVTIIQNSVHTLKLDLVPKEDDVLQQIFTSAAHNPESNLNLKLIPANSPWSSENSLSGIPPSPTYAPLPIYPIPYHSMPTAYPPPIRHAYPPNTYNLNNNYPVRMPVYPNHRGCHAATPSPVSRHRGSSPYRSPHHSVPNIHGNGMSTSQKKISNQEGMRKQSMPAVIDRKQAVYNIKNTISVDRRASPRVSPRRDVGNDVNDRRNGVYEPIIVKGEIIGLNESKRLERDAEGRLYEVNADNSALNDRLHLEEAYSPKESSERYENLNHRPNALQSNKENLRHLFITHKSHSFDANTDKNTVEALERMKKSIRSKEEFLRRTSDPVWSSKDSVHREYNVNPQKMAKPIWPPMDVQVPSSPGPMTKALSFVLGHKDKDYVLRRSKSEIKHKTSQPSTLSMLIDSVTTAPSLPTPSSSLPSSPSNEEYKSFNTVSNSSSILSNQTTVPPNQSHPEEFSNTSFAKYVKPYISTLTRIQENIPSGRNLSASMETVSPAPSVRSTTPTELIISSPKTPDTRRTLPIISKVAPHLIPQLNQAAPYEAPISASVKNSQPIPTPRFVPWVGDNERIKQLQIVSTRAKRFEEVLLKKEREDKTAFHRFELSRLSQRAKVVNVAQMKEEFERRDSCSSQNSLTEKSDPYSRIPEAYEPLIPINRNRMIPVGGGGIHCEPPMDLLIEYNRVPTSTTGSSGFLRQASFHGIPQSDRLKAASEVPESALAEPHCGLGGSAPPSLVTGLEGGSSVTPPPHKDPARPQRPTFLAIEQHVGPFPAVEVNAAHAHASCTDQNHEHVSDSNSSMCTQKGSLQTDRIVRRVSYQKATSAERKGGTGEESEEDERSHSPTSKRRQVVGLATAELPSPASFLDSVATNGTLHLKLAKLHGKRAGDRSWKSVWAVMRGRALLFYKDKQHAVQTPLSPEDQVTLRGSSLTVATDYTKRRHVLRLSTAAGSQFLLQADSEPQMTAWLNSIHAAANKDVDSKSEGGDTDHLGIPSLDSMSTSLPGNGSDRSHFLPTTPSKLSETLGSEMSNSHHEDLDSSSNKSAKKLTSPLRSKYPSSGQSPTTKNRKSTSESSSSPKAKTWKGRIGRHWRKMQQGTGQPASTIDTPLPEGASIGVCLEDCPPSEENRFVPMLVAICVGVVETKGMNTQGIYRIPGNRAAVTHLTEIVNRGSKAIDLSDTRWSDVNVISSLLKKFFQRLPDPLITSELYPLVIEASQVEDPQQRMVELKYLIQELPDHHYETLRFLCFHLSHIVTSSGQNKMDVRNLAIVFGPTLVRAADDNMAKMVTDMSHQCRIVETLISHANWFFNDDENEEPPPPLPPHNAILSSLCEPLNTEMEASSQSLLLNNVHKIEGCQKDPKKLLVSTIISAANRKVQKVRYRKSEEDTSNSLHTQEPNIQSSNESLRANELPDPTPMSQRKLSSESDTEKSSHSRNRDARLFSNDTPSASELDTLTALSSQVIPKVNEPIKELLVGGTDYTHLEEDGSIRTYAGLSQSTQERIRRFELETKAMLQREPIKTKDCKWELDRMKIEEQWKQAKSDLENDDLFDRLADNPSEMVRRISGYSWDTKQSPSEARESLGGSKSLTTNDTIRPPSKNSSNRSSITNSDADLKSSSLSLATNTSAKDEKNESRENRDINQNRPNEGSDLLSAMTATFEEKMKSLQESALHMGELDENLPVINTPKRTTTKKSPKSGQVTQISSILKLNTVASPNKSSENSLGVGTTSGGLGTPTGASTGNKCRLYRDPSLHRRRMLQQKDNHSNNKNGTDLDCGNKDCSIDPFRLNESPNRQEKEKSEKRLREMQRTETQESLREKRPKELKRSDTDDSIEPASHDEFASPVYQTENQESRYSSSRRQNVRELKEKFETVDITVKPPYQAPLNTGGEKTSRKSRKSRIKRRHTVGGMKDLAKVAWLKVIEAAHLNDQQKGYQTKLPSWEQLQLFIEALAESPRMNYDQFAEINETQRNNLESQNIRNFVAKEKLGTSTPDLDSILALVLPPQHKEALKRRLSVRETNKSLRPVLESNV